MAPPNFDDKPPRLTGTGNFVFFGYKKLNELDDEVVVVPYKDGLEKGMSESRFTRLAQLSGDLLSHFKIWSTTAPNAEQAKRNLEQSVLTEKPTYTLDTYR